MKIGGSNSEWSIITLLVIAGFIAIVYWIVTGIIWLFEHVSIS